MKRFLRNLAAGAALIAASSSAQAIEACVGKFPNPITDYCWSCMFPIKVFGSANVSPGGEDFDSDVGAICSCAGKGGTALAGVTMSFWEPARNVDVTRTPYCLVGLGGVHLNIPYNDSQFGTNLSPNSGGGIRRTRTAFRHVNYYINPVMYVIGVLMDDGCTEHRGFDVAYMSAVDPSYNDEELEALMTPDAYLFGNIVALAACTADAIAANVGFPRNELFWCAGSNGSLYPMTGNIQNYYGGVQASQLLTHRTLARMHRTGAAYAAFGEDALCGYYPQLMMDKRQYKTSMTYPIPQTGSNCCQPLGRSTMFWGAGREYPVKGEDFNYAVFRKRDCCQGAISIGN